MSSLSSQLNILSSVKKNQKTLTSIRFSNSLLAKLKIAASFEDIPYQVMLRQLLEEAVDHKLNNQISLMRDFLGVQPDKPQEPNRLAI